MQRFSLIFCFGKLAGDRPARAIASFTHAVLSVATAGLHRQHIAKRAGQLLITQDVYETDKAIPDFRMHPTVRSYRMLRQLRLKRRKSR